MITDFGYVAMATGATTLLLSYLATRFTEDDNTILVATSIGVLSIIGIVIGLLYDYVPNESNVRAGSRVYFAIVLGLFGLFASMNRIRWKGVEIAHNMYKRLSRAV